MWSNTSIFIATHAWFDEEKFPRAKSENGSSKNKLNICPPDINQDQEDINNSNYPNSNTDSDHNHDDPHDSSSDNTPSDMQEESQSDEEHLNQQIQKMKSRVISNLKQNPPMMKNLQMVTLEEVVLTLPMKNPRKVVVTATNPTMDQRVIPTIRLKNLNQFQNLVHHCHEDHQGYLNP